MKKVLSAIMVMAILLTSSVGVFADGGTRFIKCYTNGSGVLTEDGRLYRLSDGLDLIDTEVIDFDSEYITKREHPDGNAVVNGVYQAKDGNWYFMNNKLISDLETSENVLFVPEKSTDNYGMTEDNSLYRFNTYLNGAFSGYTKIADNVIDFCEFSKDIVLYRDVNFNLYTTNGEYCDENGLLLENCSDIYTGFAARTNDGKWYHWGSNYEYQLEPPKMVDGHNITPKEFNAPTLASTYVYQDEYGLGGGKYRYLTWALDGGLYIDEQKIADNIVFMQDNRFKTKDGDVVFVDLSDGTFKICDTNFVDKQAYYSGIDRNGNFTYLEYPFENAKVKTVYANYKYLNRSDWADAEIALADEIGYIDSVKLFDMQSNIKREDFCNMIVDFCEKYLGRELSTTSNPFKDTKNEKVIKAYANGIITGVSSDTFAPDGRITREQMCAIMTRATKLLKPDVQFGEGIKFSDMNNVSDWAVEGINAMSGLGIVKGDGVSITPQSNTSVEQAIAMTYRLYNKIK
ncbi:MAG: S-layer homology domain-containing protein [Clostridia bacterium]|nr:S-layer homology domain-containing protein [Clostridia bacterium]